jgi:hypothetical protein
MSKFRVRLRKSKVEAKTKVEKKLTSAFTFIKIGHSSPQLCWGDEWPNPLPWGERVRVRGK